MERVGAHDVSVETFDDAGRALDRVRPFLAEDPVARNLPATLLSVALEREESVRCWVARSDDEVVGLVLQTDPQRFGLVFTSSLGVATAFGEAVGREAGNLPAVRGEVGVVAAFAGAYATVTGRSAEAADAHRLYVLGELRMPEVSGRLRVGVGDDESLVAGWAEGFVADTGWGTAVDVAMTVARLRSGQVRVWVDGGTPVAMGIASAPVHGVSRIGGIYTPPERRNAGYGAAITAGISAEQLADQARTCMLYAQLSNPVSNRIYQRLGYQAVREDLAYRFG